MLNLLEISFYTSTICFLVLATGSLINCIIFLNRHKKIKAKLQDLPKISVVMPAFNEDILVIQAIESVLNSSYKNLELIVVDDGSEDNTLEKIKTIQDPRFSFIHQRNQGKWSALNTGILAAKSDYVLVCDADGILEKDAILNGLRTMINYPEVAAVCGECRAMTEKNILNTYFQFIEYKYYNFVRFAQSKKQAISILTGPLILFRKNALLEIGLFSSSTMVEDYEISYRLLRKGYRSIIEPDFLVRNQTPVTIQDLYKQRYRWYRGNFQVWNVWRKDLFTKYWRTFLYCQLYVVGWPFLKFLFLLTGLLLGILTHNWYYLFVSNFLAFLIGMVASLKKTPERPSPFDWFLIFISPYTYDCFLHFVFLKTMADNILNAPYRWRKVPRRSFAEAQH